MRAMQDGANDLPVQPIVCLLGERQLGVQIGVNEDVCVDIYESATDVEAKEVLPAGW